MSDEPEGTMPPILAFATMDEIVDELRRRCDAFVFAWEGKCSEEDFDVISYRWQGGNSRALGITLRMRQELMSRKRPAEEDTPADEQ